MKELPLRKAFGKPAEAGAIGAEAAVGAEAFDEIVEDVIPPVTASRG